MSSLSQLVLFLGITSNPGENDNNLIDGDLNTLTELDEFETRNGNTYITITLNGPVSISGFRFFNNNQWNCIGEYTIEGSLDNSNWITLVPLKSVDPDHLQGWVTDEFPATQLQSVRLRYRERSSLPGMQGGAAQVKEIELIIADHTPPSFIFSNLDFVNNNRSEQSGQYLRISIPPNPNFTVFTNNWNFPLNSGNPNQRLSIQSNGIEWEWNCSLSFPRYPGVYFPGGFQNVAIGNPEHGSPSSQTSPFPQDFNIVISQNFQLRAYYDASVRATGSANLCFDVWLKNKSDGSYVELMLWVAKTSDVSGRIDPDRNPETVIIDGNEYQAYIATPNTASERIVLSYIDNNSIITSTDRNFSATVDLKAFFIDASNRLGHGSLDNYELISIQFGTESVSINGQTQTGSALIKALSLTIQDETLNFTFPAATQDADTGSNANDFLTSQPLQTILATLDQEPIPGDRLFGSLDDGESWIDITRYVSGTHLAWSNARLSPGGHAILFKATDAAGNVSAPFESQHYYLVSAPTGSVTISGTARQGQTLTAANTLADADGLGTIGYQWKADGIDIAGATGNTLLLAEAHVGKRITVAASYNDGHATPETVTSSASNAVENLNDAPTGSVTITGTATQGQTLTAANTLNDVDGPGTVSYQWKANGSAISGATASTLVLGEAQVGQTITVTARYTDGHGTVENVTSGATAAVGNVNDAPTGSVTITGTATQGQTLTAANTLNDADGPGTVSYQWKANGTAINGATASTLVLGEAQVGQTITVTARYTDGHGTVENVTSGATAAVGNVNDAPTGSVTITGTATQGQTLTAANTLNDADGPGTVSYQWKANGTAINGATASTLVLGEAQVGQTITVTARYTDGHGTVENVTSTATAAVNNLNDAPTGSVTITGTATQGQTL
ncbi:MAG: discoidin domain-containing protein, partial [Magnetococcales bacterium]|nr:discoidin domain-containing protein [Magnetococcales bacterium]